MKRIISGILCTLMAVSCLCGCAGESEDRKTKKNNDGDVTISDFAKETFYMLTECVRKDSDGQVLSRNTYTYNKRGLVTSVEEDWPVSAEEWSEKEMIYIVRQMPCDGVANRTASYDYDKHGNPTLVDDSLGQKEGYEYTYDSRGRVDSVTYVSWFVQQEYRSTTELEYDKDGTITLWPEGKPREEAKHVVKTTGKSADRISEIMAHTMEGKRYYYFQYDDAGNMTNFRVKTTVERETECSFDRDGHLVSERGMALRGTSEEITYQYEDGMLVGINGVELEVLDDKNGKMIVRVGDYELTYESIKLSAEDADLAWNRWNQFCGGFYTPNTYRMGMNGYRYPVFDLKTVLPLPKMIFAG